MVNELRGRTKTWSVQQYINQGPVETSSVRKALLLSALLHYSRKRRQRGCKATVVIVGGGRDERGHGTSRSRSLARLATKVHPVWRSGDLALYRRWRYLRIRDALDGFEVGAFARLLFKLELAFALQPLRLEALVIADDAGKHGLVADASYASANGEKRRRE